MQISTLFMSLILFRLSIRLYSNGFSLDNSGENVEPVVLEEAALRSKAIQQIIVIGQVKLRHIPFFNFRFWTFFRAAFVIFHLLGKSAN